MAEYVVLHGKAIATVDYRHQWMTGDGVLRRRWDNAPHHPHVSGFPHHVHVDCESNVRPGRPLGIVELLDILETEIGP